MPKTERLHNIDNLRGFAIFVMVIANASPYLFTGEFALLLRVLFSVAAPIFIFLSGFSFQLSLEKGKSWTEMIRRALQIGLAAILIDTFIWHIAPFQTFDVLYLISGGLFVLIVIRHFNEYVKIGIIASVILLTFLVQANIGYRFNIPDTEFNFSTSFVSVYNSTDTFKRAFIDGWFPFFPWFAVALLGSLVKMKLEWIKKYKRLIGTIGILFTSISVYGLISHAESMYTDRNGYLELFYPVAGWFWFLLSGILCLSIFICCLEGSSEKSLMGFNVIGQYSLFIYVVHTAIISFALIEFTTYNWSSNITGIIILMPFWLFLLLLSKILKKYFHKVKQIILIKPLFYILGL